MLDAVRDVRKTAWILLSNYANIDTVEGSVLTMAFDTEGNAKGFASSGSDGYLADVRGAHVRRPARDQGGREPGGGARRLGGAAAGGEFGASAGGSEAVVHEPRAGRGGSAAVQRSIAGDAAASQEATGHRGTVCARHGPRQPTRPPRHGPRGRGRWPAGEVGRGPEPARAAAPAPRPWRVLPGTDFGDDPRPLTDAVPEAAAAT